MIALTLQPNDTCALATMLECHTYGTLLRKLENSVKIGFVHSIHINMCSSFNDVVLAYILFSFKMHQKDTTHPLLHT